MRDFACRSLRGPLQVYQAEIVHAMPHANCTFIVRGAKAVAATPSIVSAIGCGATFGLQLSMLARSERGNAGYWICMHA